MTKDPINILLVDDQPAKLLSYEAILQDLGENLIKAGSAREALEHLLKKDIAIVLCDVCMPELDGFELARDDPQSSSLSAHRNHFCLCHRADRPRSYQRVQLRGGRLFACAGRPRTTSGQGAGICRPLPEDPTARTSQCGAGASRRGEDRRADPVQMPNWNGG